MPYKNKEDAIAYGKKYRKENAERIKERDKLYCKKNAKRIKKYREQYREENHEKILESSRQYRGTEKGKENARKASIKYSYGLLYEDWLEIWNNQNGKCAICKEAFPTPSDACVDHNHETGEIRGLLCRKCNAGIGYLDDDPKITSMATEYLLKI